MMASNAEILDVIDWRENMDAEKERPAEDLTEVRRGVSAKLRAPRNAKTPGSRTTGIIEPGVLCIGRHYLCAYLLVELGGIEPPSISR